MRSGCHHLAKVNQHFRISINSLVEFFICMGSIVDAYVMADDLARLGPSIHDQVAKVVFPSEQSGAPSPDIRILRSSFGGKNRVLTP